jgi:hypothetical protein
VEKKIYVYQIIKFCEEFPNLKDSGVSFKGLSIIDMAMNHSKLDLIYKAYLRLGDPPEEYNKFQKKINELRLIHQVKIKEGITVSNGIFIADGEVFIEGVKALEKQYESMITAFETSLLEQKKMFNETISVDIIEINKNDLIIDEKNCKALISVSAFLFCLK